jgi:hypothetical protein
MQLGRVSFQPSTLVRTLVTQQVGPQLPSPLNEAESVKSKWKGTAFKMAEAALTTFASVAILGSA